MGKSPFGINNDSYPSSYFLCMQTEVLGLLVLWTSGWSAHVFGEGTRNDTDEDDCGECAAAIHVFCAR